MRKELQNQEIENITQVAETTPIHDGYIVDKSIKMLIREIDAKICEKSYAESKIPEYSEWLDLEALNVFHEGVGSGTLKCITGFNHYGCQDDSINYGMVGNKCPRYGQEESWQYVILCKGIADLKVKYVNNLRDKLSKLKQVEYLGTSIELLL